VPVGKVSTKGLQGADHVLLYDHQIKENPLKAQKYQINTDFIMGEGPEFTTHGTMEGEIYDTLQEAKTEFDSMVAGGDEGEMFDLILVEGEIDDEGYFVDWVDTVDYIESVGPIGHEDAIIVFD